MSKCEFASLQSTALFMARAQGAVAGLQTSLAILQSAGANAADEGYQLAVAGLNAALGAARIQLTRAEDDWTIESAKQAGAILPEPPPTQYFADRPRPRVRVPGKLRVSARASGVRS